MTTVEVFAPAKINLTLHVTGQRDDGYHLLDSLVCFADIGDTIHVEDAEALSLYVEGPFSKEVPADADNLVLRAARFLSQDRGARITLTKRLPVASGIGGGSADAAATVRALCELWQMPWPDPKELLALGADVPVCLRSGLCRMSGIGERLSHFGATPEMSMVLVNPRVSVPTASIFSGLETKNNSDMGTDIALPDDRLMGDQWFASFEAWIEWLSHQRNDLEIPAVQDFPIIGDVLRELRELEGCRLARMSGSGATCFALFELDRYGTAGDLQARHPEWWIAETDNFPLYFDADLPKGSSMASWPNVS
ncbi:MAG: 4-(cytidine 5'-diphospho)-2-C-methyl-D-erythritol kinase [Pseudomonadota bacterium]